MEFNASGNPTVSALYLVDRAKQGKAYRYFNADTNQWGMCGFDMNEALDNKDNHSTYDIVGFFPWVGPLTGPNFKAKSPVHVVAEDAPKQPKAKKVARKMARQRTAEVAPKVAKNAAPKSVDKAAKIVHPDGTVFYRADRQKWIAMANGKQEAARPTAEACLAFLKKKYNIDGIVLK
jgi:hypothetical protein